MATPHADHLNVIKTWRTDPIEQANKHLEKVSSNLADIAMINRRVAADLGLEGTTARSASSRLDKLATRLLDGSQKVKQLAEVQHKALGLGKKAQSDNEEIQKNLKEVNSTLKTGQEFAAKAPVAGPSLVKDAQAERDSAHAEVDRQAKNVLRVLRESTEALARDFPFQDNEPESRHTSAPPDSAGKGNSGANGSASGSDRGPASGAQTRPARSATAWHTPDSTPSLGSSGGYTSGHLSQNGMPSDGPTLQGSHYTPSQSGGFVPSSSTHSPAHPSAVFDPLAAAATIGGGTAVAGYKAYQAVRAARAAQALPQSASSSMRSGAAVRATPPSSASIVRGATTAVRSATPSAGARGATPRGGASGVARPISSSASARSGGILRGATTASRAAAPSQSARGNGIVRGATTAVRKPASSSSVGEAGKVPGARSQTSATRETASTRGAGAASRTSSSISRTAAGRSAATGGKATTSSERGGNAARRTSAGRAASRANTASRGETSRALSSLTGRSQGRKKSKRRSHSDEPVASAEVRLYEDDKTITFLEAGRRENDRD